MSKIVIALGGNALGDSAHEQLTKAQVAAKSIADLISDGHHVVIAHGNGPQVGKIRLAFEETSKTQEDVMPFPECTAMSQGVHRVTICNKRLMKSLFLADWHIFRSFPC